MHLVNGTGSSPFPGQPTPGVVNPPQTRVPTAYGQAPWTVSS